MDRYPSYQIEDSLQTPTRRKITSTKQNIKKLKLSITNPNQKAGVISGDSDWYTDPAPHVLPLLLFV